VTERGQAFFDAACRAGLEGIVREAGGQPLSGRPHARLAQDQVPAPAGVRHRRLHAAAGLAGSTSAPSTWASTIGAGSVYVGKVGTGFDAATLEMVARRARAARTPDLAFDVGTPAGSGHHWVEPRLCAEVRFSEWTRDGGVPASGVPRPPHSWHDAPRFQPL